MFGSCRSRTADVAGPLGLVADLRLLPLRHRRRGMPGTGLSRPSAIGGTVSSRSRQAAALRRVDLALPRSASCCNAELTRPAKSGHRQESAFGLVVSCRHTLRRLIGGAAQRTVESRSPRKHRSSTRTSSILHRHFPNAFSAGRRTLRRACQRSGSPARRRPSYRRARCSTNAGCRDGRVESKVATVLPGLRWR
jgi:hypothetical protein